MISNIDFPGGGLGQDPAGGTPAVPGKAGPAEDLDSANHFLVGAQGETLRVMNPPLRPMTRREAINLAAWLVALAQVVDPSSEFEFFRMLALVKNS